jgi:hypothetical protein
VANNGRVYFAAASSSRREAPPAVFSVPLGRHAQPRIEAMNAWSPAPGGENLNYLTAHGLRTRALNSTGALNPTAIQPKPGCKDVELGANAFTVVAVRHCGRNAQVVISDGTHAGIATIDGDPGPVEYLRVARDYVAFATGTGPYKQFVFRLSDHRLLSVGSGNMAGDMPGGGATLSWTSYEHPRSPGVEHITQVR